VTVNATATEPPGTGLEVCVLVRRHGAQSVPPLRRRGYRPAASGDVSRHEDECSMRRHGAARRLRRLRSVGDLLGKAAGAIKQNDQTNGRKLVKQLQAKGVSVRSQARALDIEECNPPAA